MRLRSMLALCAATATAVSVLGVPAGAQESPKAAAHKAAKSDVREIPPNKTYKLDADLRRSLRAQKAAGATAAPNSATAAGETPPVGTVRQWIALDDEKGILYRKNYTLRGVGDKIEVWVASDSDATSTGHRVPRRRLPDATPRTPRTSPTPRCRDLVTQFDTNMFPKESAAFSVAPDRDGSARTARPENGQGGDYSGAGDKIVTLVDNVRDDNFYHFPAAPTYIAGFFSSQFNDLVDRNVMTIDAFDWLHRTGADPVDEPTADLCSSRPARARLYEGTFAHEYQHLLQHYTDPAEVNFVNEGLSDFAISLVGYGKPEKTVTRRARRATSTASRASARCRQRSTRTRATAVDRRTR